MKLLNSIQELWSYCSFCPLCQEDSRPVIITVGPDAVFTLESFNKTDNILDIRCLYRNRRQAALNKVTHRVNYLINCETNTFDVEVLEAFDAEGKEVDESTSEPKKVEKAYFFCYIQARCPNCDCTGVFSSDLEFDFLDKTISNIGLERESVYLLKNKNMFHVTMVYDRGIMLVSRCYGDQIDMIEDQRKIELPIVNFDFTDQEKAVNKIKTLILFS